MKEQGELNITRKVKDGISFRAQTHGQGDREREDAVTSARMNRPKAANKVKD